MRLTRFPELAKRGLVDAAGRPMASLFESSSSAYEAASTRRRFAGWSTSASGPNVAMEYALERLRARIHHEVRNNGYATRATRTFASESIGTGIVPRWNLEDEGLSKEIFELWTEWEKESDADGRDCFAGQQALVASSIFEGGEVLTRFRPRRMSDGLSVPFQVQVLEADFLDTSKNKVERGVAARTRLGVEFDGIGRRSAYWMFPEHPGEGGGFGLQSQRIPSRGVLHIFQTTRPGQIRGVPWLAPVLVRLHMLDEYEDAELVRKKTAALFAGFVESQPGTVGPVVSAPGAEPTDFTHGEAKMIPGTLVDLNPGESIKFSAPVDVGTSYEVFLRQQLRATAVGVGLTYEQLTGDLTGVNYSSMRGGMLTVRRALEQFQYNTVIAQFCQPVAAAWLDHAVASGALKIRDYWDNRRAYHRIDWRPPGWPWVDPLKDVTAKLMANTAGFEARDGIVAESGLHGPTIDEENRRASERAARLGLKYTTNVTAAGDRGSPSVDSSPSKERDEENAMGRWLMRTVIAEMVRNEGRQ